MEQKILHVIERKAIVGLLKYLGRQPHDDVRGYVELLMSAQSLDDYIAIQERTKSMAQSKPKEIKG